MSNTDSAQWNPYELTETAWTAFSASVTGDGVSADPERYRSAVEAAVREQVKAVQAHVEDLGVRAAQSNGWCSVFERIMESIFPAGPLDGDSWRNSDGINCAGEEWRDTYGYNRNGYNRNGFDRNGFDRNGFDRYGFDRDGRDRSGVHRDDPTRYRFDLSGFDREGFNTDGVALYNLTRARQAERAAMPDHKFRFDRDGFGPDGFNAAGFDRDGYDRDGYGHNGRGRDGRNRLGWIRDNPLHPETGTEWDPRGFNRHGEYQGTYSYTGPDGLNAYGCDSTGYNPETGYDSGGYDRDGFNRHGFNRDGDPRPVTAGG